jgi:2-polyprenyl-3-methyl-5-hydroxy-6-metoxy-1,4-benzoquinol methylase
MLITPEYLAQQRALHADPRGYGTKGSKWAPTVLHEASWLGVETVLDYGCGQGSLARELRRIEPGLDVREYDPAIAGKTATPEPADLVVCTDVLEHIEPDCIQGVLDDLKRLTLKRAFIVVSLVPAGKTLPDGRNAHILLMPRQWWLDQLGERFTFEREVVREVKGHKEVAAVWSARP